MGYQEVPIPCGTRFLVTGGSGFIGSNLCEALMRMGYFVRCLDNFSTGKRKNIAAFLDNPLFELMEGDIRDPATCLMACEEITYVLHEASWGSVSRSIQYPQLYEEINIKGTLNMLEAARQQKVRRLVYASSSSAYGDEPNLPKVEGREGRLCSPYALTKRTSEEYAWLYTKLYGLETVSLRYFNVFGRRQDPNSSYAAVIPKLISQLLRWEAPTISGDGQQSRDFTYIDNIIQANLKACMAPIEAVGEVFNIAYGGQETLIDVYHIIAAALERDEILPIYGPDRIGDIKHSYADISKARSLLGYMPAWNFEQGLKAAIEWYRQGPEM